MRAFYMRADGMPEMDSRHFRIWPLDEVKLLRDEHPALSTLALYPPTSFVVCDFLIWSHAYAITLDRDPSRATPIVGVAGTSDDPAFVAASWTEFLKLLLVDGPALYFMTSRPTPRR